MNSETVDAVKRRAMVMTRQLHRMIPSGWLLALGLLLILLLAACSRENEPRRATVRPTTASGAVAVSSEAAAASTEATPPDPSAPPPTPEVPPTPTPTPPAPLAAMVNGEYIFLADYERRVQQYEQALLDQGTDPDTAEGQELLAQSRLDVLEGMVESVLIEQGGAAMGVVLSDEELEAQLVADIEAGGGQAAFEEWLRMTGQTRDDYKEMLRQSLLAHGVMEAVMGEVPTEAEQVHVRHIVVESEQEGQGILAALEGGADFAALAQQHSLDLATKDNGGDLGWFPRGLVAPELEAAAFALRPGEISGPIALGEGYHILQVVEREEARPLSEETQMDLQRAAFEQWLEQLRAAAQIERYVEH